MKNISIILITSLFALNLNAQSSINNYKYVIVPTSYQFLGEKDKYQLNSLTKFLFNKYGYTALMEDEQFPQDLINNGCLGMRVELEDKNSFLRTKVQFHLKDCSGKLILSSREGVTKEKDINKSFNLALRDAFNSFREIDYKYQPSKVNNLSQTTKSQELPKESVEKLENKHKETERLIVAVNNEVDNEEIDEKIESEMQGQTVDSPPAGLLFAQPIKNGFQIVDTEPKMVMVLLYSGLDEVFIVKDEDAIVYKKDGKWMYSEVNGSLKSKVLNIKF